MLRYGEHNFGVFAQETLARRQTVHLDAIAFDETRLQVDSESVARALDLLYVFFLQKRRHDSVLFPFFTQVRDVYAEVK